MVAEPLMDEAVALTNKKVEMTLDDIIKMSKKSTSKWKKPPRQQIKNRSSLRSNTSQGNSRVQRFVNSRSSIRQGILAQRRSNFYGNQFPVTPQFARKAVTIPNRNRISNWNKSRIPSTSVQSKAANGGFTVQAKLVLKQRPQTLDALFANMKEQRMRSMFANMKEQRMRSMSQKMTGGSGRQIVQKRRYQQQRFGGIGVPSGSGRRFNHFAK